MLQKVFRKGGIALDVIKEVKKIENQIINWRRELHQIPEYDFDLYETSEYVQKKLTEFGVDYRIAAKTGIIATIFGEDGGPTIGIRADMDALPIKEETNLPFKSKKEGYMHACGHDAHTAMLLGVAKILSENKTKLTGNVRLIFQPAEETTGGAKPMIEEGCLRNPDVDYVIGGHIGSLFNGITNGQIGFKYGPMMASVDSFSIVVKGKGGHGALPHLCIDPIVISSEIITSIQKIVSRETNPTHPAVITIGMIEGGTYVNIVPEEVTFSGTVRTLYEEDRNLVEKRIKEIANEVAVANRARVEIEYNKYYPSVINDEKVTKEFVKAAKKVVDLENIVEIREPTMTTDDMAYYLNEVPGTYFMLGSLKEAEDGIIYSHHNPRFDINEDVLWIGTAVFIQFVKQYLMD